MAELTEEELKRDGQPYKTSPDKRRLAWERSLMALYGLTVAEYQEMFVDQGGVCAICGRDEVWRLCVDHNHETGVVRALLCRTCNVRVGVVEGHLGSIQAYLEGF